ncbi:NifU family protein [Ureaplasma miroungigenitalium]|uniref:NifU family protein n=1 Tax=Ureaplasma miroungigenitalium TaxID=1042321 RepID=A0ABT3BM83_9BACT|nr:NifU family protein [Ureaplasma miroungigenitalium]MCV3728353.1 NifU family protein [Ureaplasma miroungigenitalium]MCV3734140.1 NifU family protein [Ureaplasma miroungigenitalium]
MPNKYTPDMHEQDLKKIQSVLNDLRIYVQADGGDFIFDRYENQIVYIQLSGACVGCFLTNVTYEENLKKILMQEVPNIKDVVLTQPNNANPLNPLPFKI